MRWLLAFHIVFMVTWFAGLFYLPRLFVYHAEARDEIGRARFCVMEKRLSVLMGIGALLTIGFGVWLVAAYGLAWLAAAGWLHAKLVLVAALVGYHGWCNVQVKKFREGRASGSARYYRLMNEVPSLLLVAIVLLAVLKPF